MSKRNVSIILYGLAILIVLIDVSFRKNLSENGREIIDYVMLSCFVGIVLREIYMKSK